MIKKYDIGETVRVLGSLESADYLILHNTPCLIINLDRCSSGWIYQVQTPKHFRFWVREEHLTKS